MQQAITCAVAIHSQRALGRDCSAGSVARSCRAETHTLSIRMQQRPMALDWCCIQMRQGACKESSGAPATRARSGDRNWRRQHPPGHSPGHSATACALSWRGCRRLTRAPTGRSSAPCPAQQRESALSACSASLERNGACQHQITCQYSAEQPLCTTLLHSPVVKERQTPQQLVRPQRASPAAVHTAPGWV